MAEAVQEAVKVVAPHNLDDAKALPAVKATEASESFARYCNAALQREDGTFAGGYEPISGEQAWVLLYMHRLWQRSPERAAEKEALKREKNKELEERALERERKAKERAAEAERKAEEKRLKDAEKAAKAASDDSDIPTEGGEESLNVTPPKRRRPPASPSKAGESAGTI